MVGSWSRKGTLLLLALSMLLTACSGGGGDKGAAEKDLLEAAPKVQTLKEFDPNEKVTLKVMYYDERGFMSQYGNTLAVKFPNIDFKVVSMQSLYKPNQSYGDYMAAFDKFLEEQKPDIIMPNGIEQLEKWVDEGKLYPLDGAIKQDKFDIENMNPNVIEFLKSRTKGKLYGLAPSFSAQALFYNKDLFDKHGVSYPKDKMTWEEVFALAKKFPSDGQGDARIFGLGFSYPRPASNMVQQVASAKGFKMLEPDGKKVTFDSKEFKDAMSLVLDAYQAKAIQTPEESKKQEGPMTMEAMLKTRSFVTGNAAMSLDGYNLISDLNNAEQFNIKKVNWDVVTLPVDPANPDGTSGIYPNPILGISSDCENIRAAWEIVKYLNSDEYTKIATKSQMYQLPTRTSYVKEKDTTHNIEAFYKLKPSFIDNSYLKQVPQPFFAAVEPLLSQEVKAVTDGSKNVEEAAKVLQEKAQEALTKALAEAAAAASASPSPSSSPESAKK